MWTRNFWRQALERLVKTFAQAALALVSGDGLDILDVDWRSVVGVSTLAALASVLTSIATADMGEPGDPSAVRRTDPTT
ncbi:MAG TPA: holin [Micromonospora sp.]|nr:holin [Micromonospora sp.]